ncbi:GntR family transcriptional regulator [Paractinoplanes abujensis]|uniref:GntR family transcriptional regulator/MocR family aminotransferase n=1 Tax=Paractinoplanes abujensis TaxID=882441 RepID=A0A7W7G8U6_9ACTN|nr:PLP-dependent aminotransferase family protein [Actinoplanes abujensis]MBB4698291.1 GntR family transcriptional regulator/MocR family aminotransferase [Actinoplanes abujensis]GID19224.1 GntR family transcriptional regulator [Actinoplanes abujensis]
MPESRTNSAWETLLELPARGPRHVALAAALRAAIRSGRVPSGSALPPSRVLAPVLGCSRWVVTQAYAQLATEGYLEGRTGSATRVRYHGTPPTEVATTPDRKAFDLAPGRPDLRFFPRRQWADALSEAAASADLGYPPPGGHPELRRVLAEYLSRSRAAAADPASVLVCTSIRNAVGRLCRGLFAAGHRAIAVEDPGWGALRAIAADAGLRPVPVPVDGDGLRVAELSSPVRAVLLSPAHQFPTGAVLAPARRAALVDWARAVDGVIVEDEYDSEFRYDRKPVGCLQGLDPARVVLVGSAHKTLAPAVGVGWAVAPPRWRPALESGPSPTAIDQAAFAGFVAAGRYDRHLHRARQRYRARRDLLIAELTAHRPGCTTQGVSAGLHVVCSWPGLDERAVAAAARGAGVDVMTLADYRVAPGPPGLVLGYGNISDAAVPRAVRALVRGRSA